MSFHPEEDTFSSRVDWRLWGQVFRHALPHRRFVIPLAFTSILIAGIDSSFALVTRAAVDTVAALGPQSSLVPHALTYAGLAVGLAVGVWLFILLAGSVANHVSHDIRRDGFARLQELEFAFFDTRPTGWLVSRLTSDCDKLARIISWGFLDCLWAICLVLMIAFQLLRLDWRLGLLVLAVVPPLLVVSAQFQKRMLLSARETRKFNSMITAAFTEALGGMRTSKTLVRESENLGEFTGLSGKMFAASMRNARQSALYVPLVLTLGSVAGGLALWAGGGRLLEGQLTIGTLVAFLFYTGQFFYPVNAIANTLVQMQGAQAAGERVLGLLATEPRIKDSPAVRAKLAQHAPAASIDADRAPDGHEHRIRAIEFRDVGFSYDSGRKVLEGFSLSVQAGQTIALVGPSGGGKTTIVSLASRFYEPTSGAVLVNGVDTRERSLAWLQSQLGIVLQQPHLFRGSVRDNIRYGRLAATDAEVEAAARLVNAHGFISGLEKG